MNNLKIMALSEAFAEAANEILSAGGAISILPKGDGPPADDGGTIHAWLQTQYGPSFLITIQKSAL